jgi:hypothetical protein
VLFDLFISAPNSGGDYTILTPACCSRLYMVRYVSVGFLYWSIFSSELWFCFFVQLSPCGQTLLLPCHSR